MKSKKNLPIIDILHEFIEAKKNKGEIKHQNYKGYQAHLGKIKAFLASENIENLSYSDFTYNHYERMILFIRSHRMKGKKLIKNGEPIRNNYLKRILGLVNSGYKYALKKGYTKAILFDFESFKDDTRQTEYLTLEELTRLEKVEVKDIETEFIRDIFLFCAYTGFLHADLKTFEPDKHTEIEEDGTLWIKKPRSKTNIFITQIMHHKARNIFEKWETLQPYYDMKHNRTLKVLAKICGIKKEVSIRVARRTFAMLNRNDFKIPDEIAYKLMGHANTKNLQKHYANTIDHTIKEALLPIYKEEKQPQSVSKDDLAQVSKVSSDERLLNILERLERKL